MFFETTLLGSIELDITLKLLLAALAGGLVGLEREKHGRPAGLRTNLLVAVGSCVMMIVSEAFYLKYGVFDAESTLRLDPSRVAAQIVTGIGFLGAGVILKEGASVRGLTTAASLWAVAGLGMAFGMGFFSLGVIATALVLISLTFLKKLDPIMKKDRFLTLSVTALNRDGLLEELLAVFAKRDLEVSNISSLLDFALDELFYQVVITQQERSIGHELMEEIKQLEGIRKIRYH
ncbi:MAG: MgtC/SapB family protein [Desulfuromonadales bacterium]|jgi:putative Mg2+ transporter-C (MgtC) family protein|nr:MgtC/SapB family protein [Desulfuromonadales bacterium]MDH3868720.1 MgtC/SapB family protein [Desulfuromonadales bacterium]